MEKINKRCVNAYLLFLQAPLAAPAEPSLKPPALEDHAVYLAHFRAIIKFNIPGFSFDILIYMTALEGH